MESKIETTKKLNKNTARKRKVFGMGKGVIQNKHTSIQRRRVQTMIFKLHAIAGKEFFYFPNFRMVNFMEGTRHNKRKDPSCAGLAKFNNNMIEISLNCVSWDDEKLFHVVAHELAHTWLSIGHDENCSLMSAIIPLNINSIEKTCEVFSSLVEKFKAQMR